MTNFRFSLQKALDLRRLQLELEESKFRQQAAALAELDRLGEEMRTQCARAENQVREGGSAVGRDLAALGDFRRYAQAKEKELAKRRMEGEKALVELRQAMLEARRRCLLLEKLKERRQADWDKALNRELEELANESFLARWNRGQA
jgi:hypothetical protein